MAQEPPEDHKCKDKFLVQSAVLPSSLANMPPADIVSVLKFDCCILVGLQPVVNFACFVGFYLDV
jgi:hypothetical protein